jgi:hypothetical protein
VSQPMTEYLPSTTSNSDLASGIAVPAQRRAMIGSLVVGVSRLTSEMAECDDTPRGTHESTDP